jgi:hypothetical protein
MIRGSTPEKGEPSVIWRRELTTLVLVVPLLPLSTLLTGCSREEDASAALAALEAEYSQEREEIGERQDSLEFPSADADSAARAAFREELEARNQEFDDLRDSFIPRYEALAEEYWGTGAGLEAKLWVMSRAARPDGDEEDEEAAEEEREAKVGELTEAIFEEYAESPHIEQLAEHISLFTEEQAERYLGELRENSPHANVRAATIYYPAARKLSRLRFEEEFGRLEGPEEDAEPGGEGAGPEEEGAPPEGADPSEDSDPREAFNADLQLLIDEYGDVPMGGSTYGALAYAHLTAHTEEELAIGQPAPEIVGTNVDGVEMRLSDFLGKVVVIDFWGDW